MRDRVDGCQSVDTVEQGRPDKASLLSSPFAIGKGWHPPTPTPSRTVVAFESGWRKPLVLVDWGPAEPMRAAE